MPKNTDNSLFLVVLKHHFPEYLSQALQDPFERGQWIPCDTIPFLGKCPARTLAYLRKDGIEWCDTEGTWDAFDVCQS